jgi:hypothetical protein
MSTSMREQRAPHANTHNGAAAAYLERRLEYRYQRLRRAWTACPACGGEQLLRPAVAHRQRIPEAEGICGTCGAALMATPHGRLRVLTPRRA